MDYSFKPTIILQKLSKPLPPSGDFPIGEMFAFASPSREKMMNEDLINQLRKIVYFDYMESERFAFPVIPNALSTIQQNISQFGAWTFYMNKTNEVYVIGKIMYSSFINNRIDALIDWNGSTPEVPINPCQNSCNAIGFFELDNNFLYFTNKECFEAFWTLIKEWATKPVVVDFN